MATKNNSRLAGEAKATLRLDLAFYPRQALDRAREAFSKLADIEFSKEGSKTIVNFSHMRTGVAAKVPDEFTNFALACTVSGQ
jgi:hypothetical protein